MRLISYPGQVCLVRSGWYERCVAVVQPASHWGLLQPLCSAHVWLWFRELDMIDSPDGALQLFSYSVQCSSRSPCRCCQLWACIHPLTQSKSYTVDAPGCTMCRNMLYMDMSIFMRTRPPTFLCRAQGLSKCTCHRLNPERWTYTFTQWTRPEKLQTCF